LAGLEAGRAARAAATAERRAALDEPNAMLPNAARQRLATHNGSRVTPLARRLRPHDQ